jgi:nicotinamidase-related amidase
LLTKEVRPIRLEPGRTWLLVQDLHTPFADPTEGALAALAARKVVSREFDEYTDTLRLVSASITHVIETARGHGIAVVYSCLGYAPGTEPSAFQAATGWCWEVTGEASEFPAPWRPVPGEPVFTKPGWGALANTAVARALEQERIESVIVIGTMLDFGIRQTCYELADHGFGCLVISDAVVPLTVAAEAPVTGNLAHGLTKLRSTAELLDLLTVMRADGSVLV